MNAAIYNKVILISLVALLSGGLGSFLTLKIVVPTVDPEEGIPQVTDYKNPTVDGQSMTNWDFLKKYCRTVKSRDSETCRKVHISTDVGMGSIPKAWR